MRSRSGQKELPRIISLHGSHQSFVHEPCHSSTIDRDRLAVEAVRIRRIPLNIRMREEPIITYEKHTDSTRRPLLVIPDTVMSNPACSCRPLVVECETFRNEEFQHRRPWSWAHPDERREAVSMYSHHDLEYELIQPS